MGPDSTTAAPALAARAHRIAMSGTAVMMDETVRLRACGRDLVDFGVGEPDFATPAHIQDAAIAALRAGHTKYTATAGIQPLRAAIAVRHHQDFGSAYTPEDVLATAGGKQALFSALSVLVDHGDEVVLPAPYWVSFREQIRYAGGTPVLVETELPGGGAAGFALDPDAIGRALTPRTKAVLINSPANPSGAVLSPEAFRAILTLCRRRGLWLISDECYARLVYDSAPYSIAAEPDAAACTVIAGSLSKTYAMTGWRLGYALAPAPILAAMLNLQSQSTGNATSLSQYAALAALTGPQEPVAGMLAVYRQRRDLIVAGLNALPGVCCAPPAGAFYAYAHVGGLLQRLAIPTAMDLAQRLLRNAGVVTVPGEAFGSPHHLRFSFATSTAVIEQGLDRLRAFCA